MLIETRYVELEVTRCAGRSFALYARLGRRELFWSRELGLSLD